MIRKNFIYVDYENVQEAAFGRLSGRQAHVTLVLGERHKTLPVSLVKLIQQHASQVSIIETELNGKNALDFVLACEVGMQAERGATGFFHILSKDKGFDALIRFLKSREILAARRESFSEIPVLMTGPERIVCLKAWLKEKKGGLPKKRKNLESTIQAHFGRALSVEELEITIQELVRAKIINIDDANVVTYTDAA